MFRSVTSISNFDFTLTDDEIIRQVDQQTAADEASSSHDDAFNTCLMCGY